MSLNPEPIFESPFEIIYDRIIPTSIMHPLDGNVNTVDRKTQHAIGESIGLFGLVQQFIIEPHHVSCSYPIMRSRLITSQ